MSEIDLSIIIVTYNSAEVILSCLDSIGAELKENVCIIDNGSSDNTVTIVREYGVRLIAIHKNIGFARAANIAARATNERNLCFINPDSEPDAVIFKEGMAVTSGQQLCCAVPFLTNLNSSAKRGRQPGYTRLKLIADMIQTGYARNFICRWMEGLPGYHDTSWHWPHGSCIFVSRETFFKVGGFDTRYFMYMEDVVFGKCLNDAGGKIIELSSHLVHREGQGSSIRHARRLSLLNLGRIRYAAHHFGVGFALLLGLLSLPALFVVVVREQFT